MKLSMTLADVQMYDYQSCEIPYDRLKTIVII